MKNLELLELVHKPVSDIFSNCEICSHCGDTTYFISNNSLFQYNFVENTTLELYPLNFEDVIHLKVLLIENKICIVTKHEIYIFDPLEKNDIQTITFKNIAAISWNPTEELVAIVSESGEVCTFSIHYENGEIFPQGKSSVNAKIPDTVYVGWGSKETQFRGSEGKLKKSTPVETKPIQDKKPTISWRGNGEMFVVNYYTDEKRKFVVFETPCKALYQSEETPGLQAPIAWRPAGNMIATVTDTDKQSVVIFEKNGQKRFSFDLNLGSVIVKELKWSPCAYILTVLTEDVLTKSKTIHLLTSSNYKWYEKQTLVFKSDNPLLDFDWLETTQFTYTLKVITKKEIIRYTFRHVISNSSSICAVIDGKTLQITDFKDSVIPPIMYLTKIENSSPINFVSFNNNVITIIDSENYLKTFDTNIAEIPVSTINLEETVDLLQIPLACHHFISNSEIYFAAETDLETVIYSVSPQNECNFIDAITDSLRHLIPTLEKDIIHCDSVHQSVKMINNKAYHCHLSSNCHFSVNGHKIGDHVNSFMIFDEYLLFTTKLNELHCLRMNDDLLTNDSSQNYRRSIEQGATIITAIPKSPRVVLQLPRDRLLNDQKWDEAIRFIRLEKLNANLLFDLDSERFLSKIDRFIDGVKTINELNSVCLEFEEGNVLNTIYRNWGKCQEYKGKIDAIFGEIFKYFDRMDYADYVSTIMIINLTFFTLKGALVYLQDLLKRSYDNVNLKQKLIDGVNTLKAYGCDQEKLYSESLLLYDIDLAHFVASCCQLDPRIYEPHLNSLKNMTEVERRYEINSFGKKPKTAISYLLRCQKTDEQTILDFIKTQNVSREAYETCPKNIRYYQAVSRAFAQDLSRRGCHREAGVILKRGGLLEEALEEYKLSLHWREVLDLLEVLKVEEVEKIRVVNDLAKKLTNSHGVKDAAILYEHHGNNYEMAVKILLDYYMFEDAIYIAKKYNRLDIIESDVVPLLLKHKKYLEEKLVNLSDSFENFRTRLLKVRSTKLDKISNCNEEDYRDDLFSDVGSTITKSSRSSRSRSSSASSRNRRKEEKKKQNLREGGIYEDIALIRALHCTITEIYRKGEEVRSCCFLLLQESDMSYEEVKKFHDLFWKIDVEVKNRIGEIWPPHFCDSNQRSENLQELADLENFCHLDVQYRTPPGNHGLTKLTFF